ncbi:MAG: riboflavin synthase [Polyangiales bacterium]
MFGGLIEVHAVLQARQTVQGGARLTIAATQRLSAPEVGSRSAPAALAWQLGESVAVNGVCLTVTAQRGASFCADVSSETLACSTLGRLPLGAPLHLERALALSDRLGGHLLSGHVDGRAQVMARTPAGQALQLQLQAPEALAGLVAAKGSVAVDGVSLTVNHVEGSLFSLMIVPHTLRWTHLGQLSVGAEVNLEVDLLARYVARLLAPVHAGPSEHGRWLDLLQAQGYL